MEERDYGKQENQKPSGPLRHAGDGGGDDVDDGIVLYYTIVKYSYKKGPR